MWAADIVAGGWGRGIRQTCLRACVWGRIKSERGHMEEGARGRENSGSRCRDED